MLHWETQLRKQKENIIIVKWKIINIRFYGTVVAASRGKPSEHTAICFSSSRLQLSTATGPPNRANKQQKRKKRKNQQAFIYIPQNSSKLASLGLAGGIGSLSIRPSVRPTLEGAFEEKWSVRVSKHINNSGERWLVAVDFNWLQVCEFVWVCARVHMFSFKVKSVGKLGFRHVQADVCHRFRRPGHLPILCGKKIQTQDDSQPEQSRNREITETLRNSSYFFGASGSSRGV